MSSPVRFPPLDAKDPPVTTACNYCVVGCGYQVHLWTPGTGSQIPSEQIPHMSASWIGQVRQDGEDRVAAIVPDPKCPINRGNHSIRGGTLGRTLTEQRSEASAEPAATRERLTTPLIRLPGGGWAPMSWDETLVLLGKLIVTATGGLKTPRRVGAKLYGYHSLENTFAATTLFSRVIGTPNVADHDRPSTADSSPGLSDATIHHHAFSYEDLLDCDVVFLLGSNAYECQSVMFQQAIAGRRIVVLDPRRTITADYAERTGGIHLQPQVLGADCTIVQAIARLILEEHYGEPERVALRNLVSHKRVQEAKTDLERAEKESEKRDKWRAAHRIRSFDAWQQQLLDCPDFEPTAVAADTGIPLEKLRAAAALLARPNLRSAILYEKGLIWGYNYQNTAAVANLAVLTFNFNAPNRAGQDDPSLVDTLLGPLLRKRGFCGRLGGHQKGFAKPQCTHQAATSTDKFVDPEEGLSFLIPNYQDYHLAGPVAYQPHDTRSRITFNHPEALESEEYPEDITLFWVVGCNPAGDMPDAQRKWRRIRERLNVGRDARGTSKADAKRNLLARVTAPAHDDAGLRGLVLVQQDIYPNYTSEFADVLLPASGFGEDRYTRYNGERRLRLYDKFQDPPPYRDGDEAGDTRCRPDWWIFTKVAQQLARAHADHFDPSRRAAVPTWESAEQIFDTLAAEGASNRSAWLAGLREVKAQGTGHYEFLRSRGTTGVQLPVRPGLKETPTLRHTGESGPFFVDCRWCDVRDHYASLRPERAAGEVWLTNGRVNEAWNSMYSNIRNEYIAQRYPDDLPGTVLEVNPAWARSAGFDNGDVVRVHPVRDQPEQDQGEQDPTLGSFVGVIACQESVPDGGAFALFSYPCSTLDPSVLAREFFGHGYVNNVTDGYVDPNGPISANKYGRARIVATTAPRVALPTTAQRHRSFQSDPHRGDQDRWMAREILVSRGLPRVSILLRNKHGEVVLPKTAHGVFWRTTHASWTRFLEEPVMGQFPLLARNPDGSFDAERSTLLQMLEGRGPLPRMPLRSAPLPSRLVTRVRHWIETGCPEDAFPEIQAILDHGLRIHARWYGPTSVPTDTLLLDPDEGIDRLYDRAELFLELIRPRDPMPSRMCWRDEQGRVLSTWTTREFDILNRFLARSPSSIPVSTYADIQRMLSAAVEGEPVMALHGAFWMRLDRDAFLRHRVLFAGGEIPVVRPFDGANSALVQALRGTGPFAGFKMPMSRLPVPEADIARIEKWIDDGCP